MFDRNGNRQETVLVVNDDDISRRAIVSMLKKMEFRVICAENCLHLKFACFFFTHIKAVIVEIHTLPKTCFKVTKYIRKLHNKMRHNEKVPIIFVTAGGKMGKAVNDSYDYYLPKPVSEEALTDIFCKIGIGSKGGGGNENPVGLYHGSVH